MTGWVRIGVGVAALLIGVGWAIMTVASADLHEPFPSLVALGIVGGGAFFMAAVYGGMRALGGSCPRSSHGQNRRKRKCVRFIGFCVTAHRCRPKRRRPLRRIRTGMLQNPLMTMKQSKNVFAPTSHA